MLSLLDFLPSERYRRYTLFVERFTYRSRKFSYAEIIERIKCAQAALAGRGIRKGDRIILWGQNSARWVITFYACVRSGIVVVPIDSSFSESFVAKVNLATGARLILSDQDPHDWDALIAFQEIANEPVASRGDDLLEIIYTSGTTGEPKGVMITHGNILANLVPIHDEYQKYKRYDRLVSPVGFVHLIPLSHLFGQIMALLIPQMLGGKVIFSDSAPGNVTSAIRNNRASVLVAVPKQISVLRKYVEAHFEVREPRKRFKKGIAGILQKWWRYRKVHQVFGWKFWAFISGGAALPVMEEDFWTRLGFAVIQGYGLTETAPSVTIAHPFKSIKRGFVGKPLPGLEVKLAEDREILVRGPNVSPGYYGRAGETLLKEGWLHTGDLGEFDDAGNLKILGRKKEVIVTSEGLNIYPQDLENVLNADPRVLESAVISRESAAGSQTHAVLVLKDPEADEAEIVAQANSSLENFQRIASFSLWPGDRLPRTTTGKLKRMEIAAVAAGAPSQIGTSDSFGEKLLRGTILPGFRLNEDLGMTSLDRLELLVDLEQQTGKQIDDALFARAETVAEVQQLLHEPVEQKKHYPSWNWTTWFFVRWFRSLIWYLVAFPLMPLRIQLESSGQENLSAVRGPVLFVANHQSLLDPVVILRALPFRWRHSLAIAMAGGRSRIELIAAGLFFNTYPLPGSTVGLKDALTHTGDLVDRGYSILIFPEGERTPDGELMPFRKGAGVIATELKIPVVPILLKGLFEIWPVFANGPRKKGVVHLRFGSPLQPGGKNPEGITGMLEQWFQKNYKS